VKFNANLFYFLTAFYFIDAAGYALWWYNTNGGYEPIGTAAIAMLGFMSIFLAFYINNTRKRSGALPEDIETANIEDGDSEIGFFAPWSWWPFFLGLFGAMAFASLAVGWWMFFIALPLALVALIGFVFEHSRGQFAH
jgi:hypothetical protein